MKIEKNIQIYLVLACTFSITCLLACFFLFSGFMTLADDGNPIQSAAKKKQLVIYIHGWEPDENISYKEDLKALQAVFPEREMEFYDWNAKGSFDQALDLADRTAERLAERISKLPDAERRDLILVGHSLGGRIVIKTMASPCLKGKPIRYVVSLAAAIPHDDPDIAKAIKNSLEPNIVVYNRQDYVLRHMYSFFGENFENALGAFGYAFPFRHNQLLQHEISINVPQTNSLEAYLSKMEKHYAVLYLRELPGVLARKNANPDDDTLNDSTSLEAIKRIEVIQDRPNTPMKIITEMGGETVDSFAHWKLQKIKPLSLPILKGVLNPRKDGAELYRIVDPLDYQRASGSEQAMRKSFQHIREQITNKKNQ